MDKLLLSSIKQVNKLLQDQTILPSRLTQVCIQRAKRVNKHLNSFVRITEDLAVQQSKESDERKKSNGRKGQLDGIPIAVKDNFCTKGIHTTCSSRMLEHFVPTYSATVYNRLQNSGAILIGKCNLDQFGMGSGTVDSIHGPTKNVWGSSLMKSNQDDNSQLWRIAGGSSGGSAIAVATGSCFAALGSDTGGSTRNPASYCGVIGFKPSYGLVSRHGLIPLVNSMDVPGILTRTVNDCTTILNCIAGPDVSDSTTISQPFTDITLPELPSIQGLRVGIPMEYHCLGLSSEVNSVWSKVADLMENAGAIVKQVSLPNTSASIAVYSILNVCEVSSNMARYDGIEFGLRPLHKNNKEQSEIESTEELYAESRSQGLNSIVRNRIIAGNFFLLARNYNKYFQQAMKVRRLISDDFKKVFHSQDLNSDPVDVLLTPTTLTKSPMFSEFVKKNNRDQCAVQDFCTQPANMAGIPAISIPITLSSDMLPLSLQLLGPYLSERRLLSAAKWIEQAVQYPGLPTNLFSDELDQIG